jgi:phosphinothricin acetyltransferase
MPLRFVRPDDDGAIAAIYAPIVATTAISFEAVPPDMREMRRRIETHGAQHPWIVMSGDDDAAIGYAYAGAYRARHAYRFGCETTVYVAPESRGRGIGRRLYAALAALLREQGYRRAFAGVSLPNDASVALHEAQGYALAGIAHAAGYKFGRWHDVATYAMTLRPLDDPAEDPRPVRALDAAVVAAILTAP